VDISHSWTGRIAYTRDTIPHIGKLDGVWFACGYCGSGVAMAPYLGWRMAEKILGTPEGATGFDTPAFNPVMPLYNGNPWFMRAIEAWHKFLDWRDGVRPAR
ncbi:MAG: FAD-dependent oxidoreductase, partial [Pseudomonadota bacterium]